MNYDLPAAQQRKLPAPSTGVPKPGEFTSADYAERGWKSVHPHLVGSNQMQMDLGPHYPEMRHLTTFEDLPEEHQQQLKDHVYRTYGITHEDMVRNAGAHLDNAFLRAQSEGKDYAEGQDWYSGVPWESRTAGTTYTTAGGETRTIQPSTEHGANQQAARELGLPSHIVAHMRASMSHNLDASLELGRVRKVAKGMKTDPNPDQFKTGGTPSGAYHWNARNAGRVLKEYTDHGTHPLDVMGTTSHGREGVPAVAGGEGPKPPRYAEAYVHPNQVDLDPPADRWMYRAVMGLRGKEETEKVQEHASVKSRVPDPQTGLLTHGVGLMVSSAVSRASRERGLSPAESQSVIWNHRKNEDEGRHTTPLFNDRRQGKLFE